MTSKLTITDERMAELVAFRPLPGTDINSATRDEWMAMAAELQERRKADSEPVAWLWSRDDERDVSLTPPEDDDDAADAIECGWTATPLYRHAQQPVVPDDVLDALQKVARIRLELNDFDGDRRGIAFCLSEAEEALIEVVNRRAAMLQAGDTVRDLSTPVDPQVAEYEQNVMQAGNSPVIPDGSASMLRRWLAFGRGMQNAGCQLPRNLIAETEEMLAAAPQEPKP
ncbi:TPA: hypothetical protein ACYSA1_000871 [Klebsiella oxytoca]